MQKIRYRLQSFGRQHLRARRADTLYILEGSGQVQVYRLTSEVTSAPALPRFAFSGSSASTVAANANYWGCVWTTDVILAEAGSATVPLRIVMLPRPVTRLKSGPLPIDPSSLEPSFSVCPLKEPPNSLSISP